MGPRPGPMGPGPGPKGSWNDQNDKISQIVGQVSRQIRQDPGPSPADAKRKVSMEVIISASSMTQKVRIFENSGFDPAKL